MIVCRILGDLDAFAALEPDWNDLWRRSSTATPFQSPAWLIPWQRIFAPGEIRAVAAFVDGRLAALFPLYLERSPLGRRLMPIGISISDYLDVLVDEAAPGAAEAALRELGAVDWDVCSFEQLAPEAAAHGLALPADCLEEIAEQEACPVLAAPPGGDLVQSIPARRRRQQRRALAAAETLGDVAFEADWPADAFLDLLFALHRQRWETRGEGGVLADPRVQSFHRDALPKLMQAGLARILALRIDGRPVAAYYGFQYGRRAYAYLGGFDPAFEAASPGALLIGAAIDRAVREGASEFHFLRGREDYKYSWGARDRWNQSRIWRRHA